MLDFACILFRFEQKESVLTQVEVDKLTAFVGYVTSKVLAHDTVPSGRIGYVEVVFYMSSHIFLRGILQNSFLCQPYGILFNIVGASI